MKQITTLSMAGVAGAALLWGVPQGHAQYVPPPPLASNVNYMVPNYANSPVLTKFKDSLPGLTAAGANNLGQYVPVAVADTNSFPGSAYYEIALVDYTEQMHSDLLPTKLRGYVQVETPAVLTQMAAAVPPQVSAHYPLPGGLFGVDKPHYLGPTVVAVKGTPTRVKFYNLLAAGPAGDLFIPTDVTVMGAGMGPDGSNYSQNRATLHLHGGDNPWISDGTPHQWVTPAGQPGTLIKGVSQQNVPDMPAPAPGSATFYWPNGQSGRLMFYHDHAYGMTRLDVYAGEAAAYVLRDANELALNSLIPGGELPLVIQDKTFVNDGSVPATFPVGAVGPKATAVTDPLWASNLNWGQTKGSLWFPHVYMPNQNPKDVTGANPLGRWDYGAWFWPIFPSGIPPTTSIVPESFTDTPVVNGTAYPYCNVNPTAYRFRVLNACNDRYINLQLYVASPIVSQITLGSGGSGYTAPPVVTIANAPTDITGKGATAVATVDTTAGSPTFGQVTGITLTTVGSGYTVAPLVVIAPPTTVGGVAATATAALYTQPTEVGMVPANKASSTSFPAWWTMNDTPGMTPNILDSRPGGVPDPATIGPSIIHIGTEGGLSPQAVEMPNTPIGFEQNKRSVTVLNVYDHTLFLGPAERADVVVDFSQFAGKTVILYNDAPAPLPGGDPRNDYYTGDPDNTGQGGAPTTLPGFGPNTRTVMQFRVAAGAPNPVAALTLTAPGTNYTAPVVQITDTAPGTGSGATASATVSPGIVSGVTVTLDGFGYVKPVVTFTTFPGDPAPTRTAVATATTWAFGGIASITITDPGAGYIHAPIVTITDANNTGLWATGVASVVPAGGITGLTLLTPGSGYTAPVVTITDPSLTAGGATATATVVPTFVPPYNVAPLNTAVAAAFAATQPKPIVPESAFNGLAGYTSVKDTYALISDTSLTYTPYGAAAAVTMPLGSKCIQELFDPLGRMNATLGVELPFTTATIQTTIPYGFIDPATEIIPNGGTQLWKITHNGVDTHSIHFHLFNVQVINRIGWDGAIKPPWPEELGWKETVKMNPLEDIVVALQAKTPAVPFAQPDNVRPLDPPNPIGNLTGFVNVAPDGTPHNVTNIMANFGNEYMWHCHLLGHEENDMMRPIVVGVPPPVPSLTGTKMNSSLVTLTWNRNSTLPYQGYTRFVIQRASNTAFTGTLATFTVAGNLTSYNDTSYKQAFGPYYYRVLATDTVGSGVPGYASLTVKSTPSNTVGPF